MNLTHASLESGIGGFDLAAELEGFTTVFQCEIDKICQRILKYHFPNANLHSDIRQFDAIQYLGQINVLTAGFPCQPFSAAGKRKGVEDERFIWSENLRVVRECKPDWIILENVAGVFTICEPESIAKMETQTNELFSQDTKTIEANERVLKRIITDIKQAGYVLPTDTQGTPIIYCLPACAVNAPHRRDRMFIVAQRADFGTAPNQQYTENAIANPDKVRFGRRSSQTQRKRNEDTRFGVFGTIEGFSPCKPTTYTIGQRCHNWSDNRQKRPICFDPKRTTSENKSERYKRKCGACQISTDSTNSTSRNDRKCESKPTKRPKQQSRIGTKQNSITNPNDRFCQQPKTELQARWYTPNRSRANATDPDSIRLEIPNRRPQQIETERSSSRTIQTTNWQNFPTQSPVCGGNDGIPPRLDGITIPAWRRESIKQYGNAVVVPLVQVLFHNIRKVYEHLRKETKN